MTLLWRWPRLGLPFGFLLMLVDVGVKGMYAARTGLNSALAVWTLIAQTAFIGLLAGLFASGRNIC
ncbi:hypothetical protein [Deinococcus aluminii]|uniref:hypothetical protein n=1 Tax=Deinococcus aluminii TaxID=1656885 RepID=UPI0031E4EA1C